MNSAKRKRIAVNTRLLLKDKLEGIGIYTHEILRRLVQDHPEVDFYFLFDRPWSAEFIYAENVKPIQIAPPTRHPFLWWFWLIFSLPRTLKNIDADLFVSLDGFASLRGKTPQLIAIHDLNFVHRPKDLTFLVRNFYTQYFPTFARKGDMIITVSNFSKLELIDQYGIESEKIVVAGNALPSEEKTLWERPSLLNRANEWTKNKTYFSFIGAIHPRKNVKGLLESFEIFKNEFSNVDVKLIIAGTPIRSYKREWEELLRSNKYNQSILAVGRVTELEKKTILMRSKALLYPSFYEGFGIPMLEAWKAKTAVLASDSSAIPEIAGDAAVLINPHSPRLWATQMQQILNNEVLRTDLVEKGIARLHIFSWEKSSLSIWKEIENLLNKNER